MRQRITVGVVFILRQLGGVLSYTLRMLTPTCNISCQAFKLLRSISSLTARRSRRVLVIERSQNVNHIA